MWNPINETVFIHINYTISDNRKEKGMEFERYIHTTEELLRFFRLIDDEYDNWTEEQDRGITVSLDEFYHERGFIDSEDFSITKMMYDMTDNQIAINQDLSQNAETNNNDIEILRRRILFAKRNEFYENIRISLNSRN